MSNITVQEAQAWADRTKLDLGTILDGELEAQVSTQVLARVAASYDVSSWTNSTTTPKLVKTVIAMYYVAWLYDRIYSDDNDDANAYSTRLRTMADAALQNIIDGITQIPGVVPANDQSSPVFYPTDASSAMDPTPEDPSLGPAKFSINQVF